MDLRQIQYFVTACERGSLSKAAECLYTSQPNVSKYIRLLEDELGRPLLDRNGKGVVPTVYGKTVLEYARLMLRSAETIASLALPHDRSSFTLSSYPSNLISDILAELYREASDVFRVEYRVGTTEEIAAQVSKGLSEIGIVYVAKKQAAVFQHLVSHKNLIFEPLFERNICVYVGPENNYYEADSIDFSELRKLRFVGGIRDQFSMEHHLETVSLGVIDQKALNFAAYTNSDHLTMRLLQKTDVCWLGIEAAGGPHPHSGLRTLTIKGCEPFLQLGYVKVQGVDLSDEARLFLKRFCSRYDVPDIADSYGNA